MTGGNNVTINFYRIMGFYDANRETSINDVYVGANASVYAKLMRNVYVWMAGALAVTGLTAAYVAKHLDWVYAIAQSQLFFWGIMIAELVLVFTLSARIMKMSFATAGLMFIAYSVLNGVTFSFLFLAYSMQSIASTFFVTAGTFGTMALIGATTKRDLSKLGNIAFMALIGLIIATVVNIFLHSTMLMWITTYAGVLIFVALTAYDSQKIKKMLMMYGTEVNESTQKLALLGSLSLYLDFINLFIYLLRIFGGNRN